jgi:hypothetical protein
MVNLPFRKYILSRPCSMEINNLFYFFLSPTPSFILAGQPFHVDQQARNQGNLTDTLGMPVAGTLKCWINGGGKEEKYLFFPFFFGPGMLHIVAVERENQIR